MNESILLRICTRYLLPLLVLFSIYTLLRGHNEPGGGFIGGLLAAAGFILNSLGRVPLPDATRPPFPPHWAIAMGLILAAVSGVPALFADTPYMLAMWGPGIPLPFVGEVKLGTPLVFDVGVYFVVLGVATLLFYSMAEAD